MVQVTKNIEVLIDEGGEITLGALPPHECAATAADGSNCLAMVVRRDGESLNTLLKRLDKAIGLAWSNDMFIDEVNDGESDLL
jgi:hypothetical protein